MRERELRRLFLRFRRRGDVQALTRVFDATAPALLGLARQLVRGSDAPEDVLQATYLTAIERAASFDASQPLLPWLAGILVHVARRANERAGRRVEPARLDERAPADPAELASESELGEALRRALAELPERYRRVLLPFLTGGERPSEIARERGLAPGTVRVQIHRGLELLRKALPAGYAAAALVVPDDASALARVRARVEGAARSAAPAGTAAPAASTPLAAVGARSALGVVALVVAGVGVWQLGRLVAPDRAEQPPVLRAAAAETAAPAVEGEALAAAEPAERASRRDLPARDGAAGPAASTLIAQVSGIGPRAPGDLVLTVARADAPRRAKTVAVPGDGPLAVALDDLLDAPGEAAPGWRLAVAHPALAPFERVVGEGDADGTGRIATDVPLELTRNVLEGRVVPAGPATEEAPRVAFYADSDEPDLRPPGDVTFGTCAADGSFRLVVSASSGWFAAAADEHAPHGERLEIPAFQIVDLGVVALELGAAIEGVAYSAERAIEPGSVVAESVEAQGAPRSILGGASIALLPDRVVSAYADAAVDEAGRFRIGGLTPGEYDLLFVPRMGTSGYSDPNTQGVRVHAPVSGIELESPVRVYTLRVRCEGRPVADATVHYFLGGGNSVSGPTRADGSYAFFLASTDETRHRIVLSKPGFDSRELALAAADFGAGRELEVELARNAPPSSLTLELATTKGPVGPLRLDAKLAGHDWTLVRFLDGGEAVVALGEVPAGELRVSLRPEPERAAGASRLGFWLATEATRFCRPDTDERARVDLRPAGRAVFHVSGLGEAGAGTWHLRGPGAGGPLALATWEGEGEEPRIAYAPSLLEADGSYSLLRALEPGDHVLELRRPEREPLALPFTVTAGDVADVRVELE